MYRQKTIFWHASIAAAVLTLGASGAFGLDLASNLVSVSGGAESASGNRRLAATFSTNATTYYLTSVTLQLANPTAGLAELRLYTDGNLEPGTLVATLTSPQTYSPIAAPTVFTAAGIPLNPNQTYWLVLQALTGEFTWSWSLDSTGSGVGFNSLWDVSSDAGAFWHASDVYPPQMTVTVSTTQPVVSGDLNCDNVLNVSDIPPFIQALLDPGGFTGCNVMRADMNGDAVVDGRDVQDFAGALVGD